MILPKEEVTRYMILPFKIKLVQIILCIPFELPVFQLWIFLPDFLVSYLTSLSFKDPYQISLCVCHNSHLLTIIIDSRSLNTCRADNSALILPFYWPLFHYFEMVLLLFLIDLHGLSCFYIC